MRIRIDIDVEAADINDLYVNRAILKMIDQGYQEDGIETPEYIIDKLQAVNAEIINRNRAELQRRLRAAKARREGLKTREEKATQLDQEIATLEQKLNVK